jgi:hypothetical protein
LPAGVTRPNAGTLRHFKPKPGEAKPLIGVDWWNAS